MKKKFMALTPGSLDICLIEISDEDFLECWIGVEEDEEVDA